MRETLAHAERLVSPAGHEQRTGCRESEQRNLDTHTAEALATYARQTLN
jgi:hypothetical protein